MLGYFGADFTDHFPGIIGLHAYLAINGVPSHRFGIFWAQSDLILEAELPRLKALLRYRKDALSIMSTPAQSGPPAAKMEDRRMSLGKYVKRMSSVFKRERPNKSSASTASAAPAVLQVEQPKQEEVAKATVAPAA